MDIGVLYGVVAGVGMIVDGVILNRIIATKYKKTIDRPLCRLLLFFMFFSMVDMIWGFFMSQNLWMNLTGYRVFTYAFHLCAALSAFFWAGYSIYYMNLPKKFIFPLNFIRFSLLLAQLWIIVSNLWNSAFFKITDDYVYHAYSMRTINFIIQFSYYCLLILANVIAVNLATDPLRKTKYKEVMSFSLIPLIFGLGQVTWPDAPMYSLGFMVTSVLIYSFNVTKYREEYLAASNDNLSAVVSGLSEDFQALYSVNLNTHAFQKFHGAELSKTDWTKDYTDNTDFFEEFRETVKATAYEDDVDMMLYQLSKKHIVEELSEKKSFSFNYRMMLDGKPHYYMCKVIKPSSDDEGCNIIIGIFDDDERVHDEMEKSEQLRDAMEKAESANRAKTAFLFNMSHDVRTPMNAILGFTDIARKNLDNQERIEDCLNKVNESGQHLLMLINDVLSMSRLESGKVTTNTTPNSLKELTVAAVSIVNSRAVSHDIKLTYDFINMDNEYVFCDATHLNQILINLLSNSVKYTQDGGKVNLMIEQFADEDNRALYKFTVEDNGIGMSEEFLGHVFDEFAREQSSTLSGVEGTGLGMSIVKRLVDSMDGTIDVYSKQNEGTKVVFRLKFEKCSEVDVNKDETESGALDTSFLKDKRVLLVDDNELNREIARDTLEDFGLIIEEAVDGADALGKHENSETGYYSLILMDVQMPRMNGYDATRAIRNLEDQAKAEIPIVAMTANAFEEDKQNAFSAGMNDHIAKPIERKKVISTLRKYLK